MYEIFALILYSFHPICIKFSTGDVYKKLSIEFCEIQCRENHTLLRGVNEFPYFSTFIVLFDQNLVSEICM